MKKEFVKPETKVVLLHSRNFLMKASGEYPDMLWGDDEEEEVES